MVFLQPILGIFAFIALAVLFSERRRLPDWRLIAVGLGLQFAFALLVFRIDLLHARVQSAVCLMDGATTGSATLGAGFG